MSPSFGSSRAERNSCQRVEPPNSSHMLPEPSITNMTMACTVHGSVRRSGGIGGGGTGGGVAPPIGLTDPAAPPAPAGGGALPPGPASGNAPFAAVGPGSSGGASAPQPKAKPQAISTTQQAARRRSYESRKNTCRTSISKQCFGAALCELPPPAVRLYHTPNSTFQITW